MRNQLFVLPGTFKYMQRIHFIQGSINLTRNNLCKPVTRTQLLHFPALSFVPCFLRGVIKGVMENLMLSCLVELMTKQIICEVFQDKNPIEKS